MTRCDAELCPNWTGQGCACEVFGLERPAPADTAGPPEIDYDDEES